METPIQKAIGICDDLLMDLEVQLRRDYDKTQPKLEVVEMIRSEIRKLVTDEKEMINQIYSNCEKIKNQ